MTAVVHHTTATLVEQAEKELLSALALGEPSHGEINALISGYRAAAEASLFTSFTEAAAKETEHRLWTAHSKVNNKYRSHLAKCRDAQGKKRPVERRKVEKHYLDFIKSSMRFYREYVQRLASHFKSPPEIMDVAYKLHLDTLSADALVEPSQEERQLILESCHATLVRLGDLSRYREMELQTKERNWAPAFGYYNLARAINPSSGASHNQFAVIALADGNHMSALYHLYRALSVEAPYPRARENLDAEFKKILDRKRKNQLFTQSSDRRPGAVLQAWFVYLHARLNAGANFPEYEQLEDEVLTNLSMELKERPLGDVLNKFALTNIAAQHLASIQATDLSANGSQCQAFTLYLRFNIKTFSTLLQILLSELEQLVTEDADISNASSPKDISNAFSAAIRRSLPTLRQYSRWLVSNASHLVALENHEFLAIPIVEFWRIYARVLTLLGPIFEDSSLPNLAYLLDEDEDTIAFTPFQNLSRSRRHLQASILALKPRSETEAIQRHDTSAEMLLRVKGLIEDGMSLAAAKDDPSQVSVPLAIEDLRFRFREKNLLAESNCSNLQRASSTNINDIENGTYNGPPLGQSTDISEDSRSTAASISRSTAMHRMVDSLVAPEASENVERNLNSLQSFQRGPSPGSAVGGSENGPFSSLPSFPKATNSPQVDSPAHIPPALPNIWDSPFTPRPGEAGSVLTISSPSHNFPANATAHTPIAQSSNTTFREALQRQQQELEMQQSSMYDLPTSLSRPASSVPNAMFLGRHSSPIPSPFSGSPSIPSATFPASEVQRSASQLARFGAVGQTPPSGQGG